MAAGNSTAEAGRAASIAGLGRARSAPKTR